MGIDSKDILIKISSHDDRKAFNLFYDIYYEQIFRYSYYFLKNKEASQELVSDIFFSIWRSRETLNNINNIDAWLYVVTRNEANRYLADKNKKDKRFVSLDQVDLHIKNKDGDSPMDQLLIEEIETLLTKVINDLPEKCRVIFLMARNEGLKPKEIANILSIQESTVRVQLKIGIEKIVENVKPHFPDLMFSMLILIVYLQSKIYE